MDLPLRPPHLMQPPADLVRTVMSYALLKATDCCIDHFVPARAQERRSTDYVFELIAAGRPIQDALATHLQETLYPGRQHRVYLARLL